MSLIEDITGVTKAHTLNARETWPGSHACGCGWKGYPEKKGGWGKPHHVHLAEVLAEWFLEYEH